MILNIYIEKDNRIHIFSFLNNSDFDRLYFENEFVINLTKRDNHCYSYKAFFFQSNHIFASSFFRSKKEMYFDVQKLLKEELYNVVQ